MTVRWQSKTIWFNALVAGAAALEASVGVLQPFVPGNIFAYFTLVLTVGNAILRAVTTQPLVQKDK